jgi:hypothetical protein
MISSTAAGPLAWRRSSRCISSGCVEVTTLDDQIVVRDSKDAQSPLLSYTTAEWVAFIEGVKAGEFDVATLGAIS